MMSASTRGRTSICIGIEAERAHGVDFLAHLHRADFGGEGAAGTAGDDDRGKQQPDLAQEDDGDEIDGKDVGAELLELRRTLLGDDRADEKGEQADQRQRVEARFLHVVNERNEAQTARIADRLPERADDRAKKGDADDGFAPDGGDGGADALDDFNGCGLTHRPGRFRTFKLAHLVEQDAVFVAQALVARGEPLRLESHRRPVEHPCTRRIEPRDPSHIEDRFACRGFRLGELPQSAIEGHHRSDGPIALGLEPQDIALRLNLVGCLSQRASSAAGCRPLGTPAPV